MEKEILYKEEVYAIVGAAMNVHKELGCGFTEPVYQDALEIEFQHLGISYEREKPFPIFYKGVRLEKYFRPDFVCYDKIIIELKALDGFNSDHYSQVFNYLKASNMKLGLLINFGLSSLVSKRVLFEKK